LAVTVCWYPHPSPEEQAEVTAWLAGNDTSRIAVIAINPSMAMMESIIDGWGTTEPRSAHATLADALTAAARRMPR
jgi:hypothetical protein